MSLNLYQRIVAIMDSMGAVGKGGKTSYGERFEYHRIDDIDDKLRLALVEHGVVAVVTEVRDRNLESFQEVDKYGKPRTTWYSECLLEITLINADNPEERLVLQGWGQGLDYSDKATGKAISYAAKSIYLSAFHLRGQPDNEDEDIRRSPKGRTVDIKPEPTPEPAQEPTSAPRLTTRSESLVQTPEQQGWLEKIMGSRSFEELSVIVGEVEGNPDPELARVLRPFCGKMLCDLISESKDIDSLSAIGKGLASAPDWMKESARVTYSRRLSVLSKSK